MFVRQVTFVDHFEVADVKTEFSANMCLYDIDRDDDIELIIGNWDSGDLQNYGEADVENRNGELHIIKYGAIWRKVSIDGMVSSVIAGDVVSHNNPHIIVFCSNCLCYFYHIVADIEGGSELEECQMGSLQLAHKQTFAPNAKCAIIEDMDNDGVNEVFVGFTDRIVRMYRWVCRGQEDSGMLEELIKWELCSQIGRVTFHCSAQCGTQALVSQAGGSYAILLWKTEMEGDEEKIVPYIDYKSTNNEYKDNMNSDIRSEIIGNIRRCNVPSRRPSGGHSLDGSAVKGQPPYLAVCTIDGEVMLLDDNEIIWQVHLDRGELFGMSKVDITNNDVEEVVISSWEGVTYIINHHKEVVRFIPKHQCQAFISGSFAVAPGVNQPVLIYSTFENSLMIYYNLNLQRIPARSFFHDLSLPLKNKIKARGIDVTNEREMQKFINEVLYHWPLSRGSRDSADFFEDGAEMVKSPLTKIRPHRSDAFANN